jgi:hypothetical protein
MSVENLQEKDWRQLKEQYVKQIEDVLTESSQPNVESIISDVRSHLDRRFEELQPQQRTCENFQKIITEMGPPSDYAELAGEKPKAERNKVSTMYIVVLTCILTLLTAALLIMPVFLPKSPLPTWTDTMRSALKHESTQDKKAKDAAIQAAESWLQLIDKGYYSESWSQAAEYFKKYVSEDQWKTSLEAARKPLGKMLSRKVKNSTYTTQAPGAPDGQYVIIQFETSFENKAKAIETVTPMMDSDGRWHVSGYYIK